MPQELKYDARMQKAIKAISDKGAFLTVATDQGINTMTIGWASIGYFWGEPVLTVAVRDSRYTYELIEKTDNFTVSIPFSSFQDELKFCGTKSGRNYDKIKECQLTLEPGKKVSSPVIAGCDLHYECTILLKGKMNPSQLAESCQKWYPKKDYHTFYYGKIVACYQED